MLMGELQGSCQFQIGIRQHVCGLACLNSKRRNSLGTLRHGGTVQQPFRNDCLRIYTVGQDCSLGKMAVSLEVQLKLAAQNQDAKFVATGQTGILISGEAVLADCVVLDFVNGSVETLVRRNQQHDILQLPKHPRQRADVECLETLALSTAAVAVVDLA